jgi:hypothetical protein
MRKLRMKPPGTPGLQGEAPLRKLATLIVVAGLLAAPSALAANGTITKGYGGKGANVQAVLGAKAAPKATAAVASSSALPFTGADLALVSAAGIALLGMGFGLRKIARRDGA